MKHEFLLPQPGYQQPKLRVRTLLGHCLYRRVIIWTITLLLLFCLTAYGSGGLVHRATGGMLDFAEFGKGEYWSGVVGVKKQAKASGTLVVQDDDDQSPESGPTSEFEPPRPPPHWLKYRQ